MQADLLELLHAAAIGDLGDYEESKLAFDPRPAVCVVLASGGYPGKIEIGKQILGLDDVKSMKDVKVFHAGTKEANGRVYTDGGRVVGVTALGNDLAAAKARAYEAVKKIQFLGMHYRSDIADRALKK